MIAEPAALRALLARPDIAAVMAALNGQGEEARLIGGAVRNVLIGEPVSDIDIATTALPQETVRRARAAGFRTIPTGIEHGTVTVLVGDEPFEVTTLRSDVETDGRRAVVAFGRDFAADALRRDFTMNALGLDATGRLHDYAGGLDDLAVRRVRFIGEASRRIAEDYLRILRFFRFHARYGRGEPGREALEACLRGRDGLGGLSRERVRAETLKLLVAPLAAPTLATMAAYGLLVPVLGGVPYLSRFAAMAEGGSSGPGGAVHPAFRLAALAVATREDAARLRERLRLSNEEHDRIERLAFAQEALAGRKGGPDLPRLRHLAVALGADAVSGALVLLAARAVPDRQGEVWRAIADLGRTPPFLPMGQDVLRLGVAPGRAVGIILAQARRHWIEAGCPADAQAQADFLRNAALGWEREAHFVSPGRAKGPNPEPTIG